MLHLNKVPTTADFVPGRNVLNAVFTFMLFGILILLFRKTIQFKKLQNCASKASNLFSVLPGWPIVGPIFEVMANKDDLINLALKWLSEYGPNWEVNYFGMKFVFIHDPTLLKPLLESREVGHLDKSFFYDQFVTGPFLKGLFNAKAKHWIPRRKVMNAMFSYEALKGYVGIFQKHADQIVTEISSGTMYDEIFHVKTLDVIAEIASGKTLEEMLGRKSALEFHKNMSIYKDIMTTRAFGKPWLMLPSLFYFHPLQKTLNRIVSSLESMGRKIVQDHSVRLMKNDGNEACALDMMVQEKLSETERVEEMLTMFIGGHETISGIVISHLWFMALEQDHQKACQKEIDELFDSMEESSCQKLTVAMLNDLKYLDRCIKESLRIFPVFSIGTCRELKSPLFLNEELILRKGTHVLYVPYLLHRDPKVYPNPEKYDPDRFLLENTKNRSLYAYLPFSGGARNCIGWKMALLELKVMFAVILRNFDLHTIDRYEDIRIQFGFTLSLTKTPKITFSRRRLV